MRRGFGRVPLAPKCNIETDQVMGSNARSFLTQGPSSCWRPRPSGSTGHTEVEWEVRTKKRDHQNCTCSSLITWAPSRSRTDAWSETTMLNRAMAGLLLASPLLRRGKKKKKEKQEKKATCIAAENNCRGTCQICSAASGASFDATVTTVTAGYRACQHAALRPRRRNASCQRPARSPTFRPLVPQTGQPRAAQAYLLVGGDGHWRELGEWDEEACGWLQVRALIDRGKCEREGVS